DPGNRLRLCQGAVNLLYVCIYAGPGWIHRDDRTPGRRLHPGL
ncbi:MAG: hypothetical protein, partial [Olavius algarvensis Delta 4 endosymbiont]